jgi:hypothetical protein
VRPAGSPKLLVEKNAALAERLADVDHEHDDRFARN